MVEVKRNIPCPWTFAVRALAAEAVCIFPGFKACSLQTGKAVQSGPLPKILSCQLAEFGVNSLF